MNLFKELRRRKVFRATSFYAVAAWGASLGAAELFPTFGLPEESVRWFVIAAVCLLPLVALLAWVYELTPSGIERDPIDRNNAVTALAPQKTSSKIIVVWDGKRLAFHRSFTIGRDESCELQIEDPQISRRHAKIVAQDGSWHIVDLDSSNGISVNGELVSRSALPNRAILSLYDGCENIEMHIDVSNNVTNGSLLNMPTKSG